MQEIILCETSNCNLVYTIEFKKQPDWQIVDILHHLKICLQNYNLEKNLYQMICNPNEIVKK